MKRVVVRGLVTQHIETTIRTNFEVTEVGAGFSECFVGNPDCESHELVVAEVYFENPAATQELRFLSRPPTSRGFDKLD
jgi:hypothetical protein